MGAQVQLGSTARLSPCRTYRYELGRRWGAGPLLTWCMLNPSKADEVDDDPTIRKCVGFSERWGYGAIRVVNLFALIATNPRDLLRHPDPIGPDNFALLSTLGGHVIAAWGASIPKTAEADAMARVVRGRAGYCLGRTKNGEPCHPVRLAYSTPREPFGTRRTRTGGRE